MELKHAHRKGSRAKALGRQLTVEAARYVAHPDARHLVCIVIDHEGQLTNPAVWREITGARPAPTAWQGRWRSSIDEHRSHLGPEVPVCSTLRRRTAKAGPSLDSVPTQRHGVPIPFPSRKIAAVNTISDLAFRDPDHVAAKPRTLVDSHRCLQPLTGERQFGTRSAFLLGP